MKVFQGLEGSPLELVYDGGYTGHYSVSNDDLILGNVLAGDRPHPSLFCTFAYYSKVLSHTVGGNGHVTGGEVLDNHLAGSAVTMGTVEPPDGGGGGGGGGSTTAACDDLPATEFSSSLAYLDVNQGSSQTITFHVPGLPDPGQLDLATLSMQLDDADHPGEEGTVLVNGNGPLDLPAKASWNDAVEWAELAIPVGFLVEGTNTFAFGAGSGSQTFYGVGKLALTVEGPACDSGEEEQDDPPSQDGGTDLPDDPGQQPDEPELGGQGPMDEEVAHGLTGNICTLTAYGRADGSLALLALLLGPGLVILARRSRSTVGN